MHAGIDELGVSPLELSEQLSAEGSAEVTQKADERGAIRPRRREIERAIGALDYW